MNQTQGIAAFKEAIGDGAKQARDPQVRAEISILAKAIDTLGGEIARMEERLAPVLMPEQKVDGAVAKEGSLVPLAEDLRAMARQVQAYGFRIRSIVDRCEL